MRVAFVDTLFSWPANGGADADLFHVLVELQRAGVHVQLFYARIAGAEDRGIVAAEALPFPSHAMDFAEGEWTPHLAATRFRAAVDAFAPQAVFAMHGFNMKPLIIQALASYPLVSRYYAHELTCAKDPRRFREGAPCPNDFLRTPDICRACAAEAQRTALFQQPRPAWTADYVAARAFDPAYHQLLLDTLRMPRVLIVSNTALREELTPFHPDIRVVPGGTNITSNTGRDAVLGVHPRHANPEPPHAPDSSSPSPPSSGERDGVRGRATHTHHPTRILMAGRADDPLKGLNTFTEAGRLLWQQRQDYQMIATHYDHTLQQPWLKIAGWLSHAETMALYHQSDIVCVPSIWREPFGLVAVEAMAAARPVVASRSGGLADIVRHEDTGLLVPPGDAPALAAALRRMLDDPALRQRMGKRGRAVAEEEYDWDKIIARHYLPLLEELAR